MQSIYLFAWVASVLYGLETVVGKLISKHSISNPWLLNFLWTFLTLALTIPVALYNGALIPTHWWWIVLASLIYALNSILFIISLMRLDVSVISPLYSFRTAFAVLLGAIFLGEILNFMQYFLIFIIFIAGLLVNIDERFKIKSFFNKGIVIVFVYMFVLAMVGATTK